MLQMTRTLNHRGAPTLKFLSLKLFIKEKTQQVFDS